MRDEQIGHRSVRRDARWGSDVCRLHGQSNREAATRVKAAALAGDEPFARAHPAAASGEYVDKWHADIPAAALG